MKPSRILICGGRGYTDYLNVCLTMQDIKPHIAERFCIIQGGAKGADYLAKKWAQEHGIACIEVAANWDRFDKRAGRIRNGWMLEFAKPDLVIAFPGGYGTDDMVCQATLADITVHDLRGLSEADKTRCVKIES